MTTQDTPAGGGYVRHGFRAGRGVLEGLNGAAIVSVEQAIARGVGKLRICTHYNLSGAQYDAIEAHMADDSP